MENKELPHTMMIWQGRDPKSTPTQNAGWGIEHFEDKYKLKATAIGCHESVMVELIESFPSVTVFADKKAYAPNQFHVYGASVPTHEVNNIHGG